LQSLSAEQAPLLADGGEGTPAAPPGAGAFGAPPLAVQPEGLEPVGAVVGAEGGSVGAGPFGCEEAHAMSHNELGNHKQRREDI
jgi:hypothetical protein